MLCLDHSKHKFLLSSFIFNKILSNHIMAICKYSEKNEFKKCFSYDVEIHILKKQNISV